jgi:hypothetical protein
MASSVRGFALRDLTQHGKAELAHVVVNPGKTLPASATGNLFAVTGEIVVLGLFGIVSTILQASNVSPTLGVTGLPAGIAAAPASPYNATAVGAVISPPLVLGGALPAPVVAQAATAGSGLFVVNAANITITTATTVTGAITWVLSYAPLMPKSGASATFV